MDYDEKIYRRYYRDINDNRKYPLNLSLKTQNIDRINIDRRIDISDPTMKINFEIKKFIYPNETVLDIVKQILHDEINGDILIFESGKLEVNNTVIKINNILPENIIAIPYYSDMFEEYKEFLHDIHKNKNKIKISKNDINNILDNITLNKILCGDYSYKYIIIVATNIAEASITISTLKYVIDTGLQKKAYYDYELHYSKLIQNNISKLNMIQRTGRVGRTSPGSVYYTYDINKLDDNTPIYNINTENISINIIYTLLSSINNKNDKLNAKNDINDILNKNIIDKINDIDDDIKKIIQNQYYINNIFYDYYGDIEQYDYKNKEKLEIYYGDGYNFETLYDKNGSFYLIHPNEQYITRNIVGKIIEYKFGYDKNLFLKNITLIYEYLERMMLVSMYVNDNNNKIINKTTYGKNILLIKTNLEYDIEYIISYIWSVINNCEEYIIKFISLLLTSQNMQTFYNNIKIEQKNKIYIKNEIMHIINKFDSINISIEKFINFDIKKIIKKNDDYYDENKRKYNNISYYVDYDNNYTSNDNKFDIHNIKKYYNYLFNVYQSKIISILNKYNISFLSYKKYIINYIIFKSSKFIFNNNIHEKKNNEYNIKKIFDKNKFVGFDMSHLNYINKILFCIIIGKPLNIAIYNNKNNKYTNIYNLKYIDISKKIQYKIKKKYYTYYYNYNKSPINIINFDGSLMKYLSNIYNIYTFTKKKQDSTIDDSILISIKKDILYYHDPYIYNNMLNIYDDKIYIIFMKKIINTIGHKIFNTPLSGGNTYNYYYKYLKYKYKYLVILNKNE